MYISLYGNNKRSLTFDDVFLLPRYSEVLPSDTDISLKLTDQINLKVPFLSSAMDTVTESEMAIAIAKSGGIGVVHRNLNIKKQTKEIIKVKKRNLLVGAAVGTNKEDIDRAKSLVANGCDLIVIDTAHGHSEKVLKTLSKLKKLINRLQFVLVILLQVKQQKNYTILAQILSKLVLDQDQFVPLEWLLE